MSSLPPTVYRLYDEADVLLYVGMSRTPRSRVQAHEASKAWGPRIARVDIEQVETDADARAVERRAIRSENPLYNDLAPSATGRTSSFPLHDRLLGGTLEERLRDLRARGFSYDEIGQKLGTGVPVSRTTVMRWCRDLGIEAA